MASQTHTGYPVETGKVLAARYPQCAEPFGPCVVTAGGDGTVSLTWDAEAMGAPMPMPEDIPAMALAHWRDTCEITALQGELQLLASPDPTGQHANAYEAVIAWAETQDAETMAFFRRQPTWSRMSPIILAGAEAFGWSDDVLDQLFAAAAQR